MAMNNPEKSPPDDDAHTIEIIECNKIIILMANKQLHFNEVNRKAMLMIEAF